MITEKSLDKIKTAIQDALEEHDDSCMADLFAYWQLCTLQDALNGIIRYFKENVKTEVAQDEETN